ncbi:MAG: hypothetical protein KAJ58_00315 [Candidatus Pacebacteria bacterium]|nr:hypothetical protein [Candidatus Paceibacterota bacterium]
MEKINFYSNTLTLIIIVIIGFYLAYLYGRKTKTFKWNEYIALVIPPTLIVVFYLYLEGINIIKLYFISAIIGSILEYCLGLAYHKTLNKRLWTYNKLTKNGYTSLLSIPFWGAAGILFWRLSVIVGL